MAVKSADQITIIDVTDAYSVILTSEAYTFVGTTDGAVSGNTCSTQAVAFCGSAQCTSVSVSVDDIVCPTGISASVTNNGTKNPTITFTTTATISAACEATIPVSVDGITVNKKFSFAVAKTGATGAAGANGTDGTNGTDGKDGEDGADAITLTITSSAGTVFKNSTGSTILTAHVYVGGIEQTITDAGVCGSYGSIKWYKGSSATVASTSKTLTVSASEVSSTMNITAQLE